MKKKHYFFSIIKLEAVLLTGSPCHTSMNARMMSSCMHGAPADASRPPELPEASVCLVPFYCAVPAIITLLPLLLLSAASWYVRRSSDDRLVLLCHSMRACGLSTRLYNDSVYDERNLLVD